MFRATSRYDTQHNNFSAFRAIPTRGTHLQTFFEYLVSSCQCDMIAEFVAAVAVDDYDGDGDLEVFAPMLDDATLTLMATAE